jgi:DNA-binding response OmpR family regulator
MKSPVERVLLVENDPETIDLIVHQVLEPMGFEVELAPDANTGIERAIHTPCDLVIANLNLPDLSGKDLLLALNAQGMAMPAIVIAKEGMETDILQAVRLGATDYVTMPIREAELVSVLERVLTQAESARQQEETETQLNRSRQEVKRRSRAQSGLNALARALTVTTSLNDFHRSVLTAGVIASDADRGWIARRKGQRGLSLSAAHNLPKSFLPKRGEAWEDGVSTLVALSGEPLSIHGEPLSKYKISQLGRAAMVAPLKAQGKTTGVMVVMRKAERPFNQAELDLLETVVGFASLALTNRELTQALKEISRSQKAKVPSEASQAQAMPAAGKLDPKWKEELTLANAYISMLVDGQLGKLRDEQLDALKIVREKLRGMAGSGPWTMDD